MPLIGPGCLLRRLGCGGDFSEQLVGEPIAEGSEIADHEHEGAGTPDDVLPIILRQSSCRMGMRSVVALVDDCETIDRDAIRDGVVACGRDRPPLIAVAVAGNTAGAPRGFSATPSAR